MTVEPGTKIGETNCPGCAALVPLKVNKGGGVYFYCAAVLERNEKGKVVEQCFTRFNFGRTASRRLIQQFEQTGEENHVRPENLTEEISPGITTADGGEPAAGADDGGGSGEPVPAAPRAGIGAKLRHFLTAD